MSEPGVRAAALCCQAGLGREYLAAREPDDVAILLAIAESVREEREQESRAAAYHIAEGTRKVLGG